MAENLVRYMFGPDTEPLPVNYTIHPILDWRYTPVHYYWAWKANYLIL